MTKYQDWMTKQDLAFVKEICGNRVPGEIFHDFNYKAISLEELKNLDKIYITHESVTSELTGGAEEKQ